MEVAWVQSNRSSTKTFFERKLFLSQACLLESLVLERKSEGKHRNWKVSYGTTFHEFGAKEWSKGKL